MKLQLLLGPALAAGVIADALGIGPIHPMALLAVVAFFLSTLPFAARAFAKDRMVGILSPVIVAARSIAQLAGLTGGAIHVLKGFSSQLEGSLAARR